MKRLFGKSQNTIKGTSSAVLLSILIHIGLFLLAGALVVFTVIKEKEPEFKAPKAVERPKMKLKKPKVKLKKSSKPKSTTRIVTRVNRQTMPNIQLPELSGMGDGLGGGVEGFDMMPDLSEVSVFGSGQSIGNDFIGTFYDFQRDNNGRDIPVDTSTFLHEVKNFVISGWKSSALRHIYRSPKKLYATCFMVPPIRSTVAPVAFGEPDTGGYCWMVHYEGKLVHKDGITFRFWGQGDDLMMVRVGGEVVLIANWKGTWTQIAEDAFTQFWQSSSADSRKYYMGNNRSVVGDWITLEPGVPLDMDVVIGEVGGTTYCSMLAVEVKGVEYDRGRQGNPILPMFKTVEPTHDLMDAIYKDLVPGEVCITNGPVFCDFDTSGWSPKESTEAEPIVSIAHIEDEPRKWTRTDGSSMEAEFVTLLGDRAVLKDARGRQHKIPMLQLSPEDREIIELVHPPEFKMDFSKQSSQYIGKVSPWSWGMPPPKVLDYIFSAKLKQTSTGVYHHELKAEFFAIGAEITGDHFVLLDRQESHFTPTKENKRSHSFSGETVRLTSYELDGTDRGIKHSGYLIALTDSRGEIIAHTASSDWLFENLDNLKRLSVGSYMDKTCTRVFPTRPINNRY